MGKKRRNLITSAFGQRKIVERFCASLVSSFGLKTFVNTVKNTD